MFINNQKNELPMKVNLAYGKTGLEVKNLDSHNVTIIEPVHHPKIKNEIKAIQLALRQPIESRPLRDMVRKSDKVGIIFNDITRPTPYQEFLPLLLEEINHVPKEQIILFNATGTHRVNTQAELCEMLGERIVEDFKIIQNNASDRASHLEVGKTSSGNQIWLHKDYINCNFRISTGFIEPHFFAGFSGGGKAIMPGLALDETIMRNHSADHIKNSNAQWGITDGNPLWEEINEAAKLRPCHFLFNVTLNKNKQITGVFAGDFDKAHKKGCEFVKRNTMVPVEHPFDIVVTSNSGYPLDLNLYQSVKGISAASQIVKEHGSIIIATECWDGIPDDSNFYSLLKNAKSAKQLLEEILTPGYQSKDMWQAQILAMICLKANVFVYSHNLSEEKIKNAMVNPCKDIEETLLTLTKEYGADTSICFLPQGPQTIPYVAK